MAEIYLFPRLSRVSARRIMRDYRGEVPDPSAARAAGEAVAAWGASGGRRVTAAELSDLREALVDIASDCGRGQAGSKADHATFDARCTVWFGESDLMPSGEGLRDDVWTWLGVCLLPDLVSWRFPGRPEDRFLGGARNVFQRHWMRARAFDQGGSKRERWTLVRTLGEDAMVQILERPSVSSQPELARAVGRVWLERSRTGHPGGMQDVARGVIRALRILNESRGLAALEPAELDDLVRGLFEDSARVEAQARAAAAGGAEQPPARRASLLSTLLSRKRA